ncbi:MAG: hypothetical protein DRQ61_09370 [Gammaproteobacteria bacterium]|nr:MAG: hypothetical protein DRQ61_09370 [Gammaproteobacteria bacterium]
MESSEWAIFILVALIFYIPAHILPPVLLTILYSSAEKVGQRKRVIKTITDCLVTIVITVIVVAWMWNETGELLMWPFMLALLPPYIRVWKLRRLTNV